MTWGDIATRPPDGFSTGSSRKSCGWGQGPVEKASGFRVTALARHPPSRVGRCWAGCRAKPEQAERDFFPARQEDTGGLFLATGRHQSGCFIPPQPHPVIVNWWDSLASQEK